jgi:polynucleotide 5'-kinase involved in rRNA processing
MDKEAVDANATDAAQDNTGPDVDSPKDKVFDAEYVASLRKENAKYRARAKENESAAEELARLKEAERSQFEKDQERIAVLESELKAHRQRELRAAVASQHELPSFLADRIQGSTEEEMAADAEALAAQYKSQVDAKRPPDPSDTGAGRVSKKAPELGGLNPSELVEAIRKG